MIVTDATHLNWIIPCNGSRLLPAHDRLTDVDTQLRDEGNAFHWLAQEAFEGRVDVREYQDGVIAPNGIAITPMMFTHARQYLGALYPGQMEITTSWGVEGKFIINGRADHIGYDPHSETLDVDDAKYGYTLVEPENNWTLLSHAIGWWMQHRKPIRQIRIRIHQPRPYHPLGPMREWAITFDELMVFYERISATLSNPSDTLQTGPYCFKCAKIGVCPAARAANMSAIDVMQHAYTDDLSDEQLADEIRLCEYSFKQMKNRLDALKDMGMYRAKNGHVLPGHMLERTYSNRTWNKGVTPAMVRVVTGRNLTVEKIVSPSEAKALGVPDLIIDALTSRVETGVKLVSVDVSRKVRKMVSN